MKTITYMKISATLLTTMFVITGIMAQGGGTSTKEIRKDFSVNPQTKLEIYNKYGNIDVVNHDNSSLLIDVIVKVNVRDKERAEKMLDMINIDISYEGNIIRAETEIDEDFGKYFRGFHTGDDGLQINYKVTMPKTMPAIIANKYGNVFVDELTSTSTLDVKYGKLTVNRLFHDANEPLSKVNLSYSTGTIQEAKWIELDIKYSKITINESKALAVLSKYSKVYVNNATSIVSESKYDTYEIGKLNNLVTTAGYGHFKIDELTGKLQVESKYTDVIVDRINSGFEGIKINNSYGSFKLGIDPGASYRINGYSKYCNISYPEDNARVNRFNENNEMKVNGVVGNNPNPKAEVNVTSRYGNIRLIQ